MKDRLIRSAQSRAAIMALIAASALCWALVAARAIYVHEIKFLFLIWNLFLAWIPLAAALPVYAMHASGTGRRIVKYALVVIWFLFFPNAPYLVTDLVHLQERPPVPYWFDIITVSAYLFTGLFLGYLSLYLMQEIVRSRAGRLVSWIFIPVMLGLSSLGIYLGRFLRWNSWDVLISPVSRIGGVAQSLGRGEFRQLLAFSATFFAFSLVCYLIVYSFTHLHAWVERTPPAS